MMADELEGEALERDRGGCCLFSAWDTSPLLSPILSATRIKVASQSSNSTTGYVFVASYIKLLL